jgi:hypothetical protein
MFAVAGSNVSSGAVLTLVLPLGCLLVVLAVWFLVLRAHGPE